MASRANENRSTSSSTLASSTEMKEHAKSVAFASSAASVITKSLLHPLDTLKCRFQLLALSASSYSSSFADPFFIRRPSSSARAATPQKSGSAPTGAPSASNPHHHHHHHHHRFHAWQQVRQQFKGKWGFQYLYGGLPPKLLLYVPYQTLYISTYDTTRYVLMTMDPKSTGGPSSSPHHGKPKAWHTVISSVSAELMSCVVRVPMEAMKMWVQSTTSPNSVAALRQFWFARRGRWMVVKGLVVPQTIIHDIPYSVCQWLAYEWLRPWARQNSSASSSSSSSSVVQMEENATHPSSSISSSALVSFLRTLLAGGGAGLVASVITIPLDHIRTRALVLGGQRLKQSSSCGVSLSKHESTNKTPALLRPWSIWKDIVKPVYRDGGLLGFYRGGAWRVMWVTTNMALYFPIFEVLRGK